MTAHRIEPQPADYPEPKPTNVISIVAHLNAKRRSRRIRKLASLGLAIGIMLAVAAYAR